MYAISIRNNVLHDLTLIRVNMPHDHMFHICALRNIYIAAVYQHMHTIKYAYLKIIFTYIFRSFLLPPSAFLSKNAVKTNQLPKLLNTAISQYPKLLNTAISQYPKLLNTAISQYPKLLNTAISQYPKLLNIAISQYPKLLNTAVSQYPKLHNTAISQYPKLSLCTADIHRNI
jgi:hypothetical protein